MSSVTDPEINPNEELFCNSFSQNHLPIFLSVWNRFNWCHHSDSNLN